MVVMLQSCDVIPREATPAKMREVKKNTKVLSKNNIKEKYDLGKLQVYR
jgi:hypothetical protein